MSQQVVVHKGRRNTIICELGGNISTATFTSQIRTEPNRNSPLIAEWAVSFLTDGTDGKLFLELSALVTGQITASSGYMDLKRDLGGGFETAEFDGPLEVLFQGTVTE